MVHVHEFQLGKIQQIMAKVQNSHGKQVFCFDEEALGLFEEASRSFTSQSLFLDGKYVIEMTPFLVEGDEEPYFIFDLHIIANRKISREFVVQGEKLASALFCWLSTQHAPLDYK